MIDLLSVSLGAILVYVETLRKVRLINANNN